ncbi:MAG: C25 family cysteine peptidase [Candidatus Cloacimonadales bacterium]
MRNNGLDLTIIQFKPPPQITVVSSDAFSTIVDVEISGYMYDMITINGNKYDDYSLPGYGSTAEEGKPSLPMLSVLLGIPPTSNITVSINNPTYEYIYNTVVYPKQRDLFEDEISPGFIIDTLFYSSDALFPEDSVDYSDPSIWRDVRVSTAHIYPFSFEPHKSKVKVLKSFQVIVAYSGTSNINPLTSLPKYIPNMFHNLYEQNIANYDLITIPERDRIPSDYDLMLIVNENFMMEQGVSGEINRFITHKKFMGLESKLIYTSNADTEDDIKHKIFDELPNSFSHVIIVGHPNLVATSNILVYEEGETRSDEFWYVMENSSSLPFSSLGRFFVDECAELDNIITKSIDYEQDAPDNSNWVNNAVLMSGNGDGGGLSYSENISLISTTVTCLNYTILNGDIGETTIDNLSTELTNGTGLVLYRGHGNPCHLEADHESPLHFNDDITPESISGLNYNKRYPIFFNITCSTHACGPEWDGGPMYDENFGSNITNNNIALASFGATGGTCRAMNNILSVCMVEALVNPLNNNLGEIILQGLINTTENDQPYQPLHQYSLYGDPTLQVKINEVNKFDISWNDNILFLKDNNGADVSEAKVIFFDANQNIIASLISNSEGYLRIENNDILNNLYYLSIHKKDYNSKIIQVISKNLVVENAEELFFDLDVLLINGADIVVNREGSLILSDGIEVIFGNNTSNMSIAGNIITASNHFTSQSETNKPALNFSVGERNISECSFKNVNINLSSGELLLNSINTQNSTIEAFSSTLIVDSSIINGNIVCDHAELNINQSTITGNSYGIKLVDSSFEITNSDISMNDDDGVVIYNCLPGTLYRNEIKNSRICQNAGNGLEIIQSIMKVKNTTIEENSNIGMVVIGSSLVGLSTDESNQIEDSRISNNYYQEIYQVNECIEANQAHFEIFDSNYNANNLDQLLVHTEDIRDGTHLKFAGNYWGYRNIHTLPILPPASRFIPNRLNPSSGEVGYNLNPVWGPAVNVPYTYSNDEQTYYSALNEASMGNIDNAIGLFKQVIRNYPNSNYSVLSSKNLFDLVPDKTELKEFLIEESNLYVNNVIHKEIDYLINHCDIKLGNFQEASLWCENKIINPESKFDSLLAIIDLEYINLCIENESDSTKTNNLQLIHKRREKYVSFIDKKIDQLINISNISMIDENQNDIAPITTRLFNNYPNPFNPETTISFDLPQRDKVELVVYNLKGQKVKSLINEEMDMGVHKIIWNGTNNQGKEVASGVYYYRLSCGNYTKTNKMVLLK